MSEFEDIQRLIRLKRFEQPEEGFTENFLQQFHQRQRAEMLQQSSLDLFRERLATWWSNLLVPKWGMVAAAVSVCAMSLWLLSHPAEKPAAALTAAPVVPEKPFVLKLDLSDIPLARMAEHDDATLSDMLLRNHLEVRPALEGNVLPASGWQQPSLRNATPAVQAGLEGMLGK
ncbi:MAG: hypothetical protein K9N47_06245 [Prosthecobacter sp.]|uniref:hypothetical protein n=1 Tax=Prosthecobacter sp. TaxID=1965333 RepID=UPI0025CB923C|nr:hypothetical protein [Prosthecobacter sp.]MCF7785702.1 hypothetical protein [Prosthecobacter sp.]